MVRGQVVCWKQDTNGNVGRSNKNPILDKHLYEVKFPGEVITVMAANKVADSIYAHCDVN